MPFFDWGNPPINSTYAPVATASTSALLAELDSTQLGTKDLAAGQKYQVVVNWIVGADTNAAFQCEVANSTTIATGPEVFYPTTPTMQTAQYVTKHDLTVNQRLRVRAFSTNSGTMRAFISAEKQT